MENRIPVSVERMFGPIVLLKETPKPKASDIADLAPSGPFAVCDFHVQGAERFDKRIWGYKSGRMSVVDHHADDKRWERHVSSGNLAVSFVRERGPIGIAIVNHTDCDSVLSAGIVTGILAPKLEYEAAVIAADHTGQTNCIADLLQSLQDERDLAFSLECLKRFEAEQTLPPRATELLARRKQQRLSAQAAVETRLEPRGRLACLALEETLESELVAPLVPDSWAVAIAFPSPDSPGRTEVKLRLTAHAPKGVTLRRLDTKKIDPAYGGRWNAGSNKRGGGSEESSQALFDKLQQEFNALEEGWMLERAIQIAAEAHAGQTDKAGRPYVEHPLRIMAKMRTDLQRTVALLHDVVEDCDGWTFERLKDKGFSDQVLAPLRFLTKSVSDDFGHWDAYFAFIDRCTLHPVATAVKLADLEDNMDLGRIKDSGSKDRDRVRKYALARQRLLAHVQGQPPPSGSRLKDHAEAKAAFVYRFTHKVDVDVRQTEGGLIHLKSRLPVDLKEGAVYRVRGSGQDFPSLPDAYTRGAALALPFLSNGTKLYAAVRADGVPPNFAQATVNYSGRPVLRARFDPEDPVDPPVAPAKDKDVFVEMELLEDLLLEVPAGRSGKLKDCKVLVRSLEYEFQSVNHAYSMIAKEFEPLRRSVAGNVFRKVFVVWPVRDKGGELQDTLVWLDFLRERAELESLGMTLRAERLLQD